MSEPRQPKRIDMDKGSFVANGVEYFVQTQLTINRFCEFQILEKELAFSMTFEKVFQEINEACELFDESRTFGDLANAKIKLDNLRRGIAKLEEKEPTALKICTLFINTAEEDVSVWNNDTMTKKINDWKAEGIAIQDFFSFALNSVNGFINIYNQMSDRISGKGK